MIDIQECGLWLIILSITSTYILYYFAYICKKPTVFCKEGKFLSLINYYCPIIHQKYCPPLICRGGLLHSILAVCLRRNPPVIYSREIIVMQDGGEIALDWVQNDENNELHKNRTTRPTVIMLPGVTGDSRQNYITNIIKTNLHHGHRYIVFNHRGLGGSRLKSSRTYCSTSTDDFYAAVTHIKSRYPNAPLMALGVSMGGMIIFNYIAKMGDQCGLVAAMTVSVVWDMFEATRCLESVLNNLVLNRYMAKCMKQLIYENKEILENVVNWEMVMQSKTLWEIDDRFTSKIFGYPSIVDYYEDANLIKKVSSIKVPLLCLNAEDDPLAPLHVVPTSQALENENLALVITKEGGHFGFLDGVLFPATVGFAERLFGEFSQAIFEHGIECLAYIT